MCSARYGTEIRLAPLQRAGNFAEQDHSQPITMQTQRGARASNSPISSTALTAVVCAMNTTTLPPDARGHATYTSITFAAFAPWSFSVSVAVIGTADVQVAAVQHSLQHSKEPRGCGALLSRNYDAALAA